MKRSPIANFRLKYFIITNKNNLKNKGIPNKRGVYLRFYKINFIGYNYRTLLTTKLQRTIILCFLGFDAILIHKSLHEVIALNCIALVH